MLTMYCMDNFTRDSVYNLEPVAQYDIFIQCNTSEGIITWNRQDDYKNHCGDKRYFKPLHKACT